MKYLWNYLTKGLLTLLTATFVQLVPVSLDAAPTFSDVPELGVDAAGNQVAVWEVVDMLSNDSSIQSASKPFGLSWSFPPVLISVLGQDSTGPRISMNSAGNTVAIWIGELASENSALYAAMLPLGGSWSPAVQISPSTDDVRSDYVVKMNDAGDILVVYSSYTSLRVSAVNGTFGGVFSPATQISN